MKKIIVILLGCTVLAALAWLLFARTKPEAGAEKQAGGLAPLVEAEGNPKEPVQPPLAGQKTLQTQKSPLPAIPINSKLTTQQVLAVMDLPENIRTIAGLTPDKSYQMRTKAVQSLGRELSRKELDGIYAFLSVKYEDYHGELQLLEFESIRNDTLDALLRQKELPSDLGKQILKMYNDPEQNEVWRDYCVQHFGPYAQTKWKDGSGAGDDPEWAEVTNAYWQATTETRNTIAGTALIGMNTLAGRYPGLTKDQVAERSLQLARDDSCGDASRVTAFRM
ncbi:MAG: hypothetical protein WCL44_14190, partial [bacterium]